MFSTRRLPRAASRRAAEQLEQRVCLAVTPIGVPNASFESAVAPDFETATMEAWDNFGDAAIGLNPGSISYPDASDNSPNAGALASPAEGKQVLRVVGETTIGQTVGNTLEAPDVVYSMTVALGNRSDVTMGEYRIALVVGETELASATGNAESDAPNGGFADVTIRSSPVPFFSGLVGEPLRIELTVTQSASGPPPEVNFDNVRVNAITEDPDTEPPTASITPPIVIEGEGFSDFSLLFADNVGIDVATIQATDLTVTGPGGAMSVTLQGASGTFGEPSSTATFRLPAPGGAWGPEDNGRYTIALAGQSVFDTSGNSNAAISSTFNVSIAPPDTTPPTASLIPGTQPAIGASTYQFSVAYTDDVDVLVSSGNSNQITVAGPNGFSQAATLVGTDSDTGASATLRYQITAPGGTFDPPDNGTYTVSTAGASRVTDLAGNPVAEGTLGTFDLALGVGMLPGPQALFNRQQPGPEFGAATYDFMIQYNDAEGVDVSTIDGADVIVKGPTTFSATASLVSGGLQNGTNVTVTYRITAPGGTWDPSDNGTYDIGLLASSVADVEGDFADEGEVDGAFFTVNFPTPVVGGLDPTFGNGSGVSTFDPPGPPLKATDVIGFDDGSSVAVSFTRPVDNLGQDLPIGTADVTLFRTRPDGQLDLNFGPSGNGLVSLNIGGEDRASTVVQLPDGKFLVTGTTSTYNGTTETDADFFVARFNANGTVDASFGTGGFGIADFGPASFDRGNDLVVLPDGRIMVFGQSTVSDPDGDFALVRFSANGVFDTTFGANGRVVTDLGTAEVVNAVTLAADGGFVAAGSTSSGNTGSFAIVRYNADGSLFNAWGPNGNGSLLVDFLPGLDEAQSIVSQDDGRMVAGGLATTGNPDDPNFDSDFAVLRIDTGGNLDTTFGSGGKILTDFGDLASINKLILQPGGKVVASGQVITSLNAVGTTELRVAVARYNADGSLDSNFSDDGKLVIDFSSIDGSASLVASSLTEFDTDVSAAADEPLTDLEAKFEQFRSESQGLVAITKGGGILALATQGNLVAIARVIGDGGAPSLFVALISNISEIDVTSSTFTVRYVDDLAVDVARLGTGDIRVIGPNGFSQLAEFVSVVEGNTNGAERTARYRVKPGGTAFVKGDEGAYALAIEPNRIADVSGNFLQAGEIPNATFTVTIPENLPNIRVDTPLTGKFPAAVVGGSKASGGTVRVTNSGVIDVKTTVDVFLFASSDAELDTTADTQVLVINGVKLSLKPGKGKALKLKFTQYPANLPDGDYFLIARIDGADVLPELKESDNNAPTPAAINISAPFVDLSGTPVSLGGTLVPGGKGTASVSIRNGGNVAVKQAVPVGLLASPGDATLGNGDVNFATPTAKLNLKPAASKATKLSFVLPTTGFAPGTYTLIAVLDSTGVLAEKDETNNLVVLGQFTV